MSAADFVMNITLLMDHKVKAWVLVSGGWFPLQLAAVDVLLIDRNVTSVLETLERTPDRADLIADRWWLEHLNRPSPVLNPALCAMEGRLRRPQSFSEFCVELDSSCRVLARTLSNARVLRHPTEHLQSIYEVFASQQVRLERETRFLIEVCPMLVIRSRICRELSLETSILSTADRLGVPRQSLCCIAALSVLYERSDGAEPRIGRGVLKPKSEYSEQDAYNALSDLRALEFLAAGSAITGFTSGFCTRDKYLAAFWTALGISSGAWAGKSFTATFAPKSALFPRLSEENVNSMFMRVKGKA